MNIKVIGLIGLVLFLLGPLWVLLTGQVDLTVNWRHANHASAGLAPKPEEYQPAVIQVYAARTYHWRGLFAVHTWMATKAKGARHYTVYQVIGWRIYWGKPVYVAEEDIPDRIWFSHRPWLVKDIRGREAEALIDKIKEAVQHYPYKTVYETWPGPNSNTFTAFVARSVPELKLALPSVAIGKDFLGLTKVFSRAPSGSGYQISLWGLLGLLAAKQEGIEVNLLGLVWGVDFRRPAILFPGIGRIGI